MFMFRRVRVHLINNPNPFSVKTWAWRQMGRGRWVVSLAGLGALCPGRVHRGSFGRSLSAAVPAAAPAPARGRRSPRGAPQARPAGEPLPGTGEREGRLGPGPPRWGARPEPAPAPARRAAELGPRLRPRPAGWAHGQLRVSRIAVWTYSPLPCFRCVLCFESWTTSTKRDLVLRIFC